MNIEDLKEKIKTSWAEVQEHPTYNTLKEKYETLSPDTQRVLVLSVVLVVFLAVLSIPMSYLSSSGESIERFETDKRMIRELLKVGKKKPGRSALPPSMSIDDIRGRVSSTLSRFQLLPEQKGDVVLAQEKNQLVPSPIQQISATVQLKTLNLKQIVDVGHALQRASHSIKLVGLSIIRSAGKKENYFDVTYKVSAFSMPIQEQEQPKKKGRRRRSRRRGN